MKEYNFPAPADFPILRATMAQFSYKARRRSGEVVEGTMDGNDRSAVLTQIERMGMFPVAVSDARGGAAAAKASASTTGSSARTGADVLPPAFRAYFKRQRKPSLAELANYTNQLANLLNAGMPLVSALNSMGSLDTKGIPGEISKQLKADVTEGRSLSDAMKKQPVVFSELYVNMVRAGESAGSLVDVLRRMAEHYVRFAELKSRFTSAMIYPAFILILGVGILIFFMTFMLPKFMEIFKEFNEELPFATRVLVGFGDFVAAWWWLVLGLVLAAAILIKRFAATETGKRKIDGWKLSAPILGGVMKINLYAQFSRTLATLLRNGVPVLTALKIAEDVLPNRLLKDAIAKTRAEVTDGKTISQPLARSKLFPQLMIDLVRIGEETGDVPTALANVADTYESELKSAINVMMSLIQPIIIVVMALFVGLLLYSLLTAMFKLTSAIGSNRR